MLPALRRHFVPNQLVFGASIGTTAITIGLAFAPNLLAAVPLMLIAGVSWVAILSTLNIAAQIALPSWVKARGLSIYLVSFNGSLALGSTVWGWLAGRLDLSLTMAIAACGLLLAGLIALRWRLPSPGDFDLSPSFHWPDAPAPIATYDEDRGPVMVEIEYDVPSERVKDFSRALTAMGRIRRRDGAIFWQHFVDANDPQRHLEVFIVESWLQHLRQHDRITVADKAVQERLHGFHRGEQPPRVSHLLPPAQT